MDRARELLRKCVEASTGRPVTEAMLDNRQAIISIVQTALSEGQAIERARIVEWLTSEDRDLPGTIFANMIFDGDHIPSEGGQTDGN